MIRTICLILTTIAVMFPTMSTAQTVDNPKQVRVFADPEFIESGLFKYLAPRFTLKTQVRLILEEQSDAQVAIVVATGRPIAQRGDVIWAVQLIDDEHRGAERFVDWLQGEVAQNTILAFTGIITSKELLEMLLGSDSVIVSPNKSPETLEEVYLFERKKWYKKEGLRKWFSRKGAPGKSSGWVDCNTCRRNKKTGRMKCKPCGRKKGEKRAKYPSCRPTPGKCKDKGRGKTWGKKSKKRSKKKSKKK